MKKQNKLIILPVLLTISMFFNSAVNVRQLPVVQIPNTRLKVLKTEVTQELYQAVMGSNPSNNKGNTNPVENVSWYDAIYFCNKLSVMAGLTPVYSVSDQTDVTKWGYTPHAGKAINGTINQNIANTGYRLPINEEWEYIINGQDDFTYAGSNNIEEVAWYYSNSEGKTHPVSKKKANSFGLYDLNGNVGEWIWQNHNRAEFHYYYGGSYNDPEDTCNKDEWYVTPGTEKSNYIGFRIVRTSSSTPTINYNNIGMVRIPGKSYKMLKTEVTQGLYKNVMGSNPSYYINDTSNTLALEENLPVEQVSWYDAIYFCNKLSRKAGLTPVYSVNGFTDVTKWGYTPHKGNSIRGEVTQNTRANGYRLPTKYEWEYAAKGGHNYTYAGSNNLNEVGWYNGNSGDKTHPVAQKKANGYGLYDMSGNVSEWVWDCCTCGGSFHDNSGYCEVDSCYYGSADDIGCDVGFRIVCNSN